jgi:hypothetical protein
VLIRSFRCSIRTHFLGSYGPIVSFERTITAGSHKRSPSGFGFFVSLLVRLWDSSWWAVGTHRICRDHNFRGFASAGLLDSNEAWVALFHERHTNADVTIGSHLHGGLLCSDSLLRPTAAQHANPLPKPVLCVYRVIGDPDPAIDPASSASPLSEPVIAPSQPAAAPTAPPWSPPPCTYCATCSPYTSPVVEPQPPSYNSLASPVSILDDLDKDALGKSTT